MSTHRYLAALPQGKNQVALSWRFFSTDAPDTPFHIERRRPNDTWQKITKTPITQSTDYQDQTPEPAEYEYRVVSNDTPSEGVHVNSGANPSNLAIEFPLQYKPELFPVRSATGDLENNGQFGFVIVETETDRIYVCAYAHKGKLLWKYDTGLPARGAWDGRTYHVPVTVRDINNDGRSEVVFHRGPGVAFPENRYKQAGPDETLIAVDGQTGDIIWEVPWPATRGRVMQTIGALDGPGKPLTVVVQDETYRDVLLTAINGTDGSTRWQIAQERGAGHNLDIDDIDGDGLMEIICGGICYNPDGSIRWQAEPFGHTDVSKPAKFLPDHPGLQILYLVEKENPGVYLTDIIGDFRENFGCIDYENATFCVAQNPLPANHRAPSPIEDAHYRHERAQVGSGYYTYIAPPQL